MGGRPRLCRKAKDLGYPHELWTTRLLARHAREHGPAEGHACLARLAQGTVCKILNEQEVKPHKVRYDLERRDPEFNDAAYPERPYGDQKADPRQSFGAHLQGVKAWLGTWFLGHHFSPPWAYCFSFGVLRPGSRLHRGDLDAGRCRTGPARTCACSAFSAARREAAGSRQSEKRAERGIDISHERPSASRQAWISAR